ncbi:hypothetical protein B0H66DRAFT_547679 [Apodospora peruviana]|uniref:Secreted protein n=1 Tax=Apodospora peruviana TaxID=516989 RepID=A0AAE0IHV4_9PEZI|nr:hypothetical protein B0H66DRAFT_547679 [Apodospora peruviana]
MLVLIHFWLLFLLILLVPVLEASATNTCGSPPPSPPADSFLVNFGSLLYSSPHTFYDISCSSFQLVLRASFRLLRNP